MTTLPSKSNIDKGGSNPADIITKLLEMHRKSHHFSIKKTQPKVFESLTAAAMSIPYKHLASALDVYAAKTKELGKSPHPNYFLKVASRLNDGGELGKNDKLPYIREHKNLGKSI